MILLSYELHLMSKDSLAKGRVFKKVKTAASVSNSGGGGGQNVVKPFFTVNEKINVKTKIQTITCYQQSIW